MVKEIVALDEIVLQDDISPQKKKFLESCKKNIRESVRIFVERHPEFNASLSPGTSPFLVVIESSKQYDAVIRTGRWCYIDLVATRKDAKRRVQVLRADRQDFLFEYRKQKFLIKYEEIPKRKKR